MTYVLRDGVHFCHSSGRAIFLDEPADRYFCFGKESEERAFAHLVEGAILSDQDRAVLAPHLASGLLVRTDLNVRPKACTAPAAELSIAEIGDLSFRALPAIIAHLIRARRLLRSASLAAVLDLMTREGKSSLRQDRRMPDDAVAIASSFAWAKYLATAHDQCLSRSIALARLLVARGIPARLVMAVMARPFAAHCWVQIGTVVVNDRIENVRRFTPIRVV